MKKIVSLTNFIVHQNFVSLNSKKLCSKDKKKLKNLLCAISGGQDSILLLFSLLHLRSLYQFNLELVYCNHFWQKSNFSNSKDLFKLAFFWQIPIHIAVPEMEIYSEAIGSNWRKKNFSKIANFSNSEEILIGHTASDQIETAIWHILRGASPNGIASLKEKTVLKNNIPIFQITNSLKFKKLSNLNSNRHDQLTRFEKVKKFQKQTIFSKKIKWLPRKFLTSKFSNTSSRKYQDQKFQPKSNYLKEIFTKKMNTHSFSFVNLDFCLLTIIRPLLNLHRADICQVTIENNLPIFIDKTNKNVHLTRNKIRLILVPLLRYYFGIKIDLQFKNYLNTTLSEQNFFLTKVIQTTESFCNDPQNLIVFFSLPISLQNSFLKLLISQYTLKQPKQSHIKKLNQILIKKWVARDSNPELIG
jgi:tRNA(Ile)-lysidine synthase TilS/MesJ